MDLVDSNLKAVDVISVFVPYAKFLVEECGVLPPPVLCTRLFGPDCTVRFLLNNHTQNLLQLPLIYNNRRHTKTDTRNNS